MSSGSGYAHDPDLRARLQAFSPDEPGVVFPFSARLARENGWSPARARRVVEEYRRFVYLAMTAGHPVTPSVSVDQAWHLHLTYTRSYWEEMCGRVLGRPLHHEPTRGGRAEGEKFVDWYARTLDSYRAAFGEAPPADVWPAPAVRFAPAARTRQVSEATHWVIAKPRVGRRGLVAAGAAVALLGLAACVAEGAAASSLAILLVFAVPLAVLALILTSRDEPYYQKKEKKDGGGGAAGDGGGIGSGNCDADGGGDCGDGGGGCGGGCGGCGG
jgi:hypothetical protein